MSEVKLPKKFRDVCDLIRNGKTDEGLEKLAQFGSEFEPQKNAILAEIHYFNGEWEKALSLDVELLEHWDKWHYSNVRTEHLAAMCFAARKLGREDFLNNLFNQSVHSLMNNNTLVEHLKNEQITYYRNMQHYLKTGEIPYFSEKERYLPPTNPISEEEIISELQKKDKKFDLTKTNSLCKLLYVLYEKSTPEAVINTYLKIDKNETVTTMYQMLVIQVCNYLKNNKLSEEIICKMTKDRLWFVASPTQVRPMEFFTHPALFGYLEQDQFLTKIRENLV